jgi:hypothetical protein
MADPPAAEGFWIEGSMIGARNRTMATMWITYAWADNQSGDVDFVAQELQAAGIEVKLDRWNIKAGLRLWDQIADFIQSEGQCDAWLLFATQASLGSEACREEYAYALDRALNSRGKAFPVIALFPATLDDSIIPAGIRTRLYVSLQDPDWKERIVAGVPLADRERISLRLLHGGRGCPPSGGALFGFRTGTMDNPWAISSAQNEATPTMSYYIYCAELPSRLMFGPLTGPQFTVGWSPKGGQSSRA